MWGYLAEFWNKITAVGDYAVEYFQSIGHAVAGAIGGLFQPLIHQFYDLFHLVWWFADNMAGLFSFLLTPLSWLFNFGKGFLNTAFKSVEELGIEKGDIAYFGAEIFAVFDAIPYVNYIFAGAGAMLGLLFLVFVFKRLVAM